MSFAVGRLLDIFLINIQVDGLNLSMDDKFTDIYFQSFNDFI